MNNLIPNFIQEKYLKHKIKGSFRAVTTFMDISGFTNMTETLMRQGKEGAEILSTILNEIFDPIIEHVMSLGGFISNFAGDAMTIIFPTNHPSNTAKNALNSALYIHKLFKHHKFKSIENFDFGLSVKIGLSYDEVEWGILGNDTHKTYYFKGRAINNCALSEHQCSKMEIVTDKYLFEIIKDIDYISIKNMTSDYYKINTTNTKLNTENISKTNINHQNKPNKELISLFFNKNIIESNYLGEFRNIVSVFVSTKEFNDYPQTNELISAIIERADMFGGYFNSLDFGDKGCTALILFGAPISYENEIIRALNFILSIRSSFKENIRAGVVIGVAYAGIVGSQMRCTYTALGDVVNLSARFMMKAGWGEIWTCQHIYKKLHNTFVFDSIGEISFKGKSYKTKVFKLKDKKTESLKTGFLEGELIGREEEVGTLKTYTKKALKDNKGCVIYVYGNAGIGKSKVIKEFYSDMDADAYVFTLQADDILKKSLNPFVSFFEGIFEMEGIRQTQHRKASFDKSYKELCRKLREKLPDDNDIIAELEREKSIIGAVLDLHWSDSVYEKLAVEDIPTVTTLAIKDLFKSHSMIKPVITVIENIHCIDMDSMSLIHSMAQLCNSYPLIIVLSGRYNDDGSKPSLNIDKSITQNEINIDILPDRLINNYIHNKLGHKPDKKLLRVIKTKSEGNPFFIEQLCLYLVDNDYIELDKGKYLLKNENIDIPVEINSMLISRIDRLSHNLKDLIQLASVIGKEFDSQVINDAVMNYNDNVIKDLQEKDYYKKIIKSVKINDMNTVLTEGEREKIWFHLSEKRYVFMNALLVNAAYNMQLKKKLRFYHHLISFIMEKMYLNDKIYYADIAYHYYNANNDAKALEYFNKAGMYSKDNYKNEKALEYFNKVLEIYNNKSSISSDDLIELYNNMGDVYLNIGEYHQALEYYNKVYDLAVKDDGGKNLYIANSYHNISTVYWNLGELDKALENSKKALDIQLGLSESQRHIGHSYNNIAMIHNSKAEHDKALEYLYKAYDIFKELYGDLHQDIALVYTNIGMIYWFKGNYEKTLHYTNKAVSIYIELFGKNHPQILKLYNNLGMVYWNKADYDKAVEYLNKCISIMSELFGKSHPNTSILNNNLGLVYVDKGSYDVAMVYLYKALLINKETFGENHQFTAFSYTNIGKANYSKGEYHKAIENFKKAEKIRETINDISNAGFDLTYISLSNAQIGNYTEALKYAYKHLRNIKSVGTDLEHGKTHLSIAITLSKTHNTITHEMKQIIDDISSLTELKTCADDYFTSSIKKAETSNYYNTLIPAYYEYGKYLTGLGKNEEGKAKINKALILAKEKNLTSEIKKMEKII